MKHPVPAPTQAVRYIAYPKAMHQLTARLGATPEELAAWVFWGPGKVALPPMSMPMNSIRRRGFTSALAGTMTTYRALMATWFSEEEIAHFSPTERYITGEALIQRWKDKPGLQAEAFILAKIRESRLQDIHPMFGGTRGTFQEHDDFPPRDAHHRAASHRTSGVGLLPFHDLSPHVPGSVDQADPPGAALHRLAGQARSRR
jgi:hypothetical protein